MEILVAIGIIALLAGMAVVAFTKAKKAARKNLTMTSIGMISAGAEMFKNDFGVYPPSSDKDPDESNYTNFTELGFSTNTSQLSDFKTTFNSGAKLICLFLTGYPSPTNSVIIDSSNYNSDGTLKLNDVESNDACTGFGFRTRKRGKVYGPYGGAEAVKTQYSGDADAENTPKVFIDSWNHAILYYRCNYDSGANTYSYDKADNQTVTVDNSSSPTPYGTSGTDTKFNNFTNVRKDFLIISAGDVDNNFDWKEAYTNVSGE